MGTATRKQIFFPPPRFHSITAGDSLRMAITGKCPLIMESGLWVINYKWATADGWNTQREPLFSIILFFLDNDFWLPHTFTSCPKLLAATISFSSPSKPQILHQSTTHAQVCILLSNWSFFLPISAQAKVVVSIKRWPFVCPLLVVLLSMLLASGRRTLVLEAESYNRFACANIKMLNKSKEQEKDHPGGSVTLPSTREVALMLV